MNGILQNYLERKALANQLGKHERTLERWEREQTGPPPTKIGGSTYYRAASVDQWLRENERKPARPRGRR